MKTFLRKYSNLIYTLLALAILVVVVSINGDFGDTIRALGALKLRWVLLAMGLVVLYFMLRAIALRFYLKRQGYKIGYSYAFVVTGVGQFYSAVTPSATGGQPMQVVYLMRRGVPGAIASAAVSVKFIFFQFTILTLAAVTWSYYGGFVDVQLGATKGIVFLGFFINSIALLAVFLTLISEKLVLGVVRAALKLLGKMRVIKDEADALAKAKLSLDGYRESLLTLSRRPLDALVMLALAIAQVLCYVSIVACVYWSFGLQTAKIPHLITLQLLLFVTASFVPLPGAAGAQEGGFFLFFSGVFPPEMIMSAMVAWRLFTYYLLLFLGLVLVMADSLRMTLVRRKEVKAHRAD